MVDLYSLSLSCNLDVFYPTVFFLGGLCQGGKCPVGNCPGGIFS